jgi:DNA replication and repair protein RecF
MKVEAVYVCHVRNLASQEIFFLPGINEIVGENTEGKTSLLEALHLLVLGTSFRTSLLKEVIQHGASQVSVEAKINISGVHKTIGLTYDGTRRLVSIDHQPQESSSLLLGNLLGVTATVEDHELVFGPPSVRRRFLDEQIAQIDPFYVDQLNRYIKGLSHRNKLLKDKDFVTIRAWEEQLARSAAYIVHQRRRTVSLLAPLVETTYHGLFPEKEDQFSMRYLTQAPESVGDLSTWYEREYASRRDHEARYATTLVGPHRDDLEWTLSARPLKSLASLGQARVVSLALRYAEWKLLADRSSELPIFLIDDIESTLDSNRKNLCMEMCQGLGQVFATCHTAQSDTSNVIYMKNGQASTVNKVLL